MRCKDVHILIDLDLLTSTGQVREVITRDFITPVGPWIFPLSRVPMLQHVVPENLLSIPAIDPQPAADAADDAAAASPEFPRHRSITKRRIATYGATELCDGCIRGTYTHTEACRQRFNQLLNHAEPLVEVSGGGLMLHMMTMRPINPKKRRMIRTPYLTLLIMMNKWRKMTFQFVHPKLIVMFHQLLLLWPQPLNLVFLMKKMLRRN
jgi:hypothetical protein